MWSPTDEGLLAGLAAGDDRAAASFVRRYQARVFGLARSMLGDPTAAEEVAQETFLRVWRHAGAYDHRRGRVDTWLLAITRNLAIDRLRLRRADPIDPDKLEGMELMLMRAGAGEEASDEMHSLTDSLSSLPPEQRRPLVMAALYGYTAQEISEIDEIPVGTAKSRIRSGLLKLRAEREVSDER
jgi:RNA polymerase sigma-70 factor (ECF subfamily)